MVVLPIILMFQTVSSEARQSWPTPQIRFSSCYSRPLLKKGRRCSSTLRCSRRSRTLLIILWCLCRRPLQRSPRLLPLPRLLRPPSRLRTVSSQQHLIPPPPLYHLNHNKPSPLLPKCYAHHRHHHRTSKHHHFRSSSSGSMGPAAVILLVASNSSCCLPP